VITISKIKIEKIILFSVNLIRIEIKQSPSIF